MYGGAYFRAMAMNGYTLAFESIIFNPYLCVHFLFFFFTFREQTHAPPNGLKRVRTQVRSL